MTRLALLEADWPATDRALLEALFRRGGLLDEAGRFSHLKPISRRNIVTAYGRWLGWLARCEPTALLELPVDRLTPERFRSWMTSLGHLAPASQQALGDPVLWMLRAAVPEADWSAHRRIMSRIWRAVAEHRSTRKDGRILSSAVLYEAALQRSLSLGQGSAPGDLRTAMARRDMAMVAFWSVVPIRRRAFCELDLGRSLVVTSAGMELVLDETMTKTGQIWEAQVPTILHGILLDYLEQVRPMLVARAKQPCAAFWLGDQGRRYGGIHLAARIRDITMDLVGVRVSPHFFRDCAATTLAYDSPDSARLTRAVLGHRNFRTGEQHYNQAKGIEAGRQYAKLITQLSNKTA